MRKLTHLMFGFWLFAQSQSTLAQEFYARSGFEYDLNHAYDQAVTFHDNGQWEMASEYYQEVLRFQAHHTDALYNLALIQYETGDYTTAEATLERLMSLDPADKSLYELYGLIQYHTGHYDRAIASFDVALAAGTSVEILINKGLAYTHTGRHQQALQMFDEALALGGRNFDAYLGKGISLAALGQHHLAISWYDAALSLKSGNALALSNKALSLFQIGGKESAMELFREALLRDRNPNIYLARAACYLADGQADEAFYDAREALLLHPESAEACLLAAKAEQGLGHPNNAIHWLEQAIEFNSQCESCYFQMAQLFHDKGDYYESIRYLYRLLDLNPLHQEGRLALKNTFQRLDEENKTWLEKVK